MQIFRKDSAVEHFKCAKHRSCSGNHEWEPHNCEACALFKYNFSRRSNEDKESALEELTKMLQATSDAFTNDDAAWEYEDTIYSFMRKFKRAEAHSNQPEALEEGKLSNQSKILKGKMVRKIMISQMMRQKKHYLRMTYFTK